jgi:hypothetical protein
MKDMPDRCKFLSHGGGSRIGNALWYSVTSKCQKLLHHDRQGGVPGLFLPSDSEVVSECTH